VAVSPTPPRRLPSTAAASIASLVAAVLVTVMAAPAAAAESTPAELKAQIAAQNKALEPIIEQYNGLRVKLAADQAQAKKVAAQIGPAQEKATAAQARIDDVIRTVYQRGPATSLQELFATKSTTDLVELLASMSEVAHQQSHEVSRDKKMIADFRTQRVRLQQLVDDEHKQYNQLASQKTDIQAKVDHLQTLLDEAEAAAAKAAAAAAAAAKADTSTSSSSKYTKAELMPVACPYTSTTGKGHTAAVKACSLVWDTGHTPPWRMYGWADAGPDTYDCSGLTMTAWAAAGITLAHYTGSQWNESYAISESQLRPGDLVFYFQAHSHVALYVGGGWIVQAEQTGEPLKMSHMTFESPRYYRRVNGT
jgi:peptidoglycan DL-endopeptidase CwlO